MSADEKTNVIGIIPARMASSRFPGKPLADICGIPMIGHVYFRSAKAKTLNKVYMATCDGRIADYAASIGCESIMTSDKHQRASDRAKEAMLKIEDRTGRKTDIAVMIQGDEPMLYPEMIDESVEPMLKDDSIEVVNLMWPLRSRSDEDDPNVIKVVVDRQDRALYFSREPIPSRKNAKGSVTMYKQVPIIPFRREMLIRFNELESTPLEAVESIDMLRLLEHGYKVKMVRTKIEIYGVDTPADLKRVEALMKRDALFARYERTCAR